MAVLLYILSVNLESIGVGLSYGLRKIHISHAASLICAAISARFFGIALFIGAYLSDILSPRLGRVLGSVLLFLLGCWIILSSLCDIKAEKRFSIRPLGITISIMRDPSLCDFDNSSKIDTREAIFLVGASLFLFLKLGKALGAKLSSLKIPHKIWTVLSGLILILLAIVHII